MFYGFSTRQKQYAVYNPALFAEDFAPYNANTLYLLFLLLLSARSSNICEYTVETINIFGLLEKYCFEM